MSLNPKQERFVAEYLLDMNATAAYVRAGYTAASDQVAASCAHKLLRNAEIREAIDKAQCERLDRLELDADWVLIRLKRLYLEASQKGDYSSALRALESIGKHLGLFEKHQKQKREYGPGDLDRLKQELTQAGFNLERLELQYPSQN